MFMLVIGLKINACVFVKLLLGNKLVSLENIFNSCTYALWLVEVVTKCAFICKVY